MMVKRLAAIAAATEQRHIYIAQECLKTRWIGRLPGTVILHRDVSTWIRNYLCPIPTYVQSSFF